MNKQMTPLETQLAAPEDFGPARTEAGGADMDALLPNRSKKKLITTIALTIDTCRWPFGDPAEPDFHYCGKPPLKGQPYCDRHDAQSYQAARRKKAG